MSDREYNPHIVTHIYYNAVNDRKLHNCATVCFGMISWSWVSMGFISSEVLLH